MRCLALSFVLTAWALPNAHDVTPTTAPALTLTLSPASVVGGTKTVGTVALGAPAPAGGVAVTLSSSALNVAGLAAPRLGPLSVVSLLRVMVPEGESGLTFEVHTSAVAMPSKVTIGAATRTESAAAILVVTVSDGGSVD